jgi:hypothetical protein
VLLVMLMLLLLALAMLSAAAQHTVPVCWRDNRRAAMEDVRRSWLAESEGLKPVMYHHAHFRLADEQLQQQCCQRTSACGA